MQEPAVREEGGRCQQRQSHSNCHQWANRLAPMWPTWPSLPMEMYVIACAVLFVLCPPSSHSPSFFCHRHCSVAPMPMWSHNCVRDARMPIIRCQGVDFGWEGNRKKMCHSSCPLSPLFPLTLDFPPQWHMAVLPPCHCEARIVCVTQECQSFDAKGVDFGWEGNWKNWRWGHTGGEASARVFRSPSTNFRKKHVELSSLFLSVLIYLWLQPPAMGNKLHQESHFWHYLPSWISSQEASLYLYPHIA